MKRRYEYRNILSFVSVRFCCVEVEVEVHG